LDEKPNVTAGELDVLPGAGPDVIVVTGALVCFKLVPTACRHLDG
jgi:hypothetical protein